MEDENGKQAFIPTRVMKRNLALEEQTFMVRKPYLEMLQYLRQVDWPAQDNLRFLLWGRLGTGKSITMSQVHHFALNSNFIVIKFHSVRRWFSNYQEAVESEFKAGRWNFPNEARTVLEDFKYYNAKKIEGMVTHKTYKWSEAELTPEGAPLSEVIESGLSRPRFSSDCLNVLLKEIKLNIQQGWSKHPVMVMIDGINVIFQERTFVSKIKPRRKSRTIPNPKSISYACTPDELSVIVAIKHLLKNDYKNACLVASVDRHLQLDLTKRAFGENKIWWRALQQEMIPETDPDYPFALLGNHGWDQLHPFIPVSTQDYTEGELDAMIDYYADKRYIPHSSLRIFSIIIVYICTSFFSATLSPNQQQTKEDRKSDF